MVKNKSLKKFFIIILLVSAFLFVVTFSSMSSLLAKADETDSESKISMSESSDVETRAILVKMTCLLIKNENTIRAQAQNEFTLFPGKVQTKVYLYSSETYTEDYTQMKFEASNYISDLDQGESISARVDLYGQRYWRGRTMFLVDNDKEWKSVETETIYVPV